MHPLATTPTDWILAVALALALTAAISSRTPSSRRVGHVLMWLAGPLLGLHLGVDLTKAASPSYTTPAVQADAELAFILCGLVAGCLIAGMFHALTHD